MAYDCSLPPRDAGLHNAGAFVEWEQYRDIRSMVDEVMMHVRFPEFQIGRIAVRVHHPWEMDRRSRRGREEGLSEEFVNVLLARLAEEVHVELLRQVFDTADYSVGQGMEAGAFLSHVARWAVDRCLMYSNLLSAGLTVNAEVLTHSTMGVFENPRAASPFSVSLSLMNGSDTERSMSMPVQERHFDLGRGGMLLGIMEFTRHTLQSWVADAGVRRTTRAFERLGAAARASALSLNELRSGLDLWRTFGLEDTLRTDLAQGVARRLDEDMMWAGNEPPMGATLADPSMLPPSHLPPVSPKPVEPPSGMRGVRYRMALEKLEKTEKQVEINDNASPPQRRVTLRRGVK